jgi:hypothetical protein
MEYIFRPVGVKTYDTIERTKQIAGGGVKSVHYCFRSGKRRRK